MRQHNPMEYGEFAGAVDPGGLDQLVRNRSHILPHHEDAERGEQGGNNQRGIFPDPAEPTHELVLRNDGDRPGDHHGRQDEQEQGFLAPETEFGEHISEISAGVKNDRRFKTSQPYAVEEEAAEAVFLKHLPVIVPGEYLRDKGRRIPDNFRVVLEGTEDHEYKGIQHGARAGTQDQQLQDAGPEA